ncbi:MAG: DUF2651 family protein [Nanobdellota archaeon]
MINEFMLVLIILPLLTIVASAGATWVIKKIYLIPIAVLIFHLILMATIFNVTFLIWAILYTVLSFLTALLIKKLKR